MPTYDNSLGFKTTKVPNPTTSKTEMGSFNPGDGAKQGSAGNKDTQAFKGAQDNEYTVDSRAVDHERPQAYLDMYAKDHDLSSSTPKEQAKGTVY
jgi:hypothetical protein